MDRVLVGAVDIGGTKIAVAIVDNQGRILIQRETPTEPDVYKRQVQARSGAANEGNVQCVQGHAPFEGGGRDRRMALERMGAKQRLALVQGVGYQGRTSVLVDSDHLPTFHLHDGSQVAGIGAGSEEMEGVSHLQHAQATDNLEGYIRCRVWLTPRRLCRNRARYKA